MTKPTEIVIHPFFEVEGDLAEDLRVTLEQVFKMTVTVGCRLSMPARAFSPERRQYHSTELLNVLATQAVDDERIKLGITTADLFVPELNFIFGEASNSQRVALFSLARLDPRAYGDPPNSVKLMRRAVIEAVHEIGHVFGLGHCPRPNCVMWFSNTLSETDRKGSNFCQRCAKQLGVGSLIPQ